jgi:transglutaminase-like putative cysteine protease
LPPHKHVLIKAVSVVETAPAGTVTPGEDGLNAYDFMAETAFVKLDAATADFASRFTRHDDPQQTAFEVCQYINQHLIYEKGVTNVNSTTDEVLQLGRGVCQDFSHLMIATCRQLGLPARYVSGYFYPSAESEGQDLASHAWCEVYGGNGWVAYDPTHSRLYADESYIKIGVGRDYSDVTPVRGTYKGYAKESLKVSVRIYAQSAELAVPV